MNNIDMLVDWMLAKDPSNIVQISIEKLHPFPSHPFKVIDNEDMEALTESICTQGVLTPLIVRRMEDDRYEIISGHRRLYACKKAGIETVAALVTDMDRDTAAIALVDSNLHREKILPSEKAFAYKLKMDALSRQGKRTDLTSCQLGTKLRTDEQIAAEANESARQIQRYIRLTYLLTELLQKVDDGKISLSPGVELSYLDEDAQQLVLEAMDREDCTPSFSQTVRMKELYREGQLSEQRIFDIMAEPKANQKEQIRIPIERLQPVLPKGMSSQKAAEFILKACKHYKKYLQRQKSMER